MLRFMLANCGNKKMKWIVPVEPSWTVIVDARSWEAVTVIVEAESCDAIVIVEAPFRDVTVTVESIEAPLLIVEVTTEVAVLVAVVVKPLLQFFKWSVGETILKKSLQNRCCRSISSSGFNNDGSDSIMNSSESNWLPSCSESERNTLSVWICYCSCILSYDKVLIDSNFSRGDFERIKYQTQHSEGREKKGEKIYQFEN